MNVARVLTNKMVVLRLQGDTKEAVIGELLAVLARAGQITDEAAAFKVVMERERKMSTGLQSGVAIPHGKTETVENLVAAVGIKREGVAFDSLDGLPAQIIVVTLSPTNRPGQHIQFLADIGKTLGDADVREKILGAETVEAALAALCPASRITTPGT